MSDVMEFTDSTFEQEVLNGRGPAQVGFGMFSSFPTSPFVHGIPSALDLVLSTAAHASLRDESH